MSGNRSWTRQRVIAGRRCEMHCFAPDRPSKALHSSDEKYMARTTLVLGRHDETECFVVPLAVLQELADSLGPYSLGFISVSFGGARTYTVRLSAVLDGLDERRWQLLPLERMNVTATGAWALAGYLQQPVAMFGPRTRSPYENVPSLILFDLEGEAGAHAILDALQCPFDRSDIRNRFPRCPAVWKFTRPNPELSGVRYSADEGGDVYATFTSTNSDPVINIEQQHLDVLAAFPARKRNIRLIAPQPSTDVTIPLDEIALPRLAKKSTQQPFYPIQLPPQRCLALPQYTKPALDFS